MTSNEEVSIVITGQLRRGEYLVDAIRQINESYFDLHIRWVLSTWLPELEDKSDLLSDLEALDVRVIAAPPPPLWGNSTALPQLLALSNGLFGADARNIAIRTRTDALTTRGINSFLDSVKSSPEKAQRYLTVERFALNVPYFATDFQFMGSVALIQEMSILDATELSRGLNVHPEQHYFAPLRTGGQACELWRKLDIGTVFGNDEANQDWRLFRLSSPLFAATLAEYFTHITRKWRTVESEELPEATSTVRASLDELMFSDIDPAVAFDPFSHIATTTDLSLVSRRNLAKRPSTEFGEWVLSAMAMPPTFGSLVELVGVELERLSHVSSLRSYRRDLASVSSQRIDFTGLPEVDTSAVATKRIRDLEVENSNLRERIANGVESAVAVLDGDIQSTHFAEYSLSRVIEESHHQSPDKLEAEDGWLLEIRLSLLPIRSQSQFEAHVRAVLESRDIHENAQIWLRMTDARESDLILAASSLENLNAFLVLPAERAVACNLDLSRVFACVSEFERIPDWLGFAGIALESSQHSWQPSDERLKGFSFSQLLLIDYFGVAESRQWSARFSAGGTKVLQVHK